MRGQGKSRPGRSVGGRASRDQVPEVREADDGGLRGFSGQRLENARVLDEELPTGPQAGSPGCRERQIFREIRNESLAVSGAVGSVLFIPKNPCPDDPVAHGQGAKELRRQNAERAIPNSKITDNAANRMEAVDAENFLFVSDPWFSRLRPPTPRPRPFPVLRGEQR